MFVKFVVCLSICYLTCVETKPFKTMSQDLEIILRCNSSYPVNKRTLNIALIDKQIDNSTDKNFKCFLSCLYYNYEMMDDNGVFKYNAMKSILSESNLDDPTIEYLVSVCTDSENDDKCEKAYTFTKCFWSESQRAMVQSLRFEDT